MSKELTIIDERELLGKEFRIYGTFENPLFLAKDVANCIEHSNPSKMLSSIDEEEKTTLTISYNGNMTTNQLFLTEDGLYEVLMQSRKPIAKEFKKKVKEILKSVRKNGAYMTNEVIEKTLTDPDFLIQLATQLKEERNARLKVESENKLLVEENETISLENRLLNGEVFSWAGKSLINAVVRKYARGDFAKAWNEYKKNLLYSHSININSRITNYLNKTGKRTKPKTLDMLDESEIPNAIATAISMCNEANIDIGDIIKHFKEN